MRVVIVSTIGRNYWTPFEVLVASLLRTKHPNTRIVWYVFTDENEGWDGWLERMERRWSAAGVTFELRLLEDLPTRSLPLRGRARPIQFARLAAPELLAAHEEKVLYLDADMLVVEPIEDLWAVGLGESICACCPDAAIPRISSALGLPGYRALGAAEDAPYFNAGVILIDTARWRTASVTERAFDYVGRVGNRVRLFDQEALNATLLGCWRPLDERWNVIVSFAERSLLGQPRAPSPGRESKPAILHFAGILKPWQNPHLQGTSFELYRQILREVHPDHIFPNDILHRLAAAYDASVRPWFYPIERAIWHARGGF